MNNFRCPICEDPEIAIAGDLEFNGEKFEVELCEECWKYIHLYPSEIKKLYSTWKEKKHDDIKEQDAIYLRNLKNEGRL